MSLLINLNLTDSINKIIGGYVWYGALLQCFVLHLWAIRWTEVVDEISSCRHSNNTQLVTEDESNFLSFHSIRGNPRPALELIIPALYEFQHLINWGDVEILTVACWALSYLSEGTKLEYQAVIAAGVLPRLVKLLKTLLRGNTTMICMLTGNTTKFIAKG